MKKILLMTLVLCCCLFLFACAPENDANPATESNETEYEEELSTQSEEADVSFENLADPVMINADFEVTTNPDGSFDIKTNLPSETELSLTLSGKGYIAQCEAFVNDGMAVSECFTNNGEQLVGDYTLEVLMPIPNVQSDYVRHFIGENGEYLTGPYVEGALGSVVVSKEFKVSFSPSAESSNETANTTSPENNSAPDGNYYRTPTGKKYHLDPDCGGKNSYATTNISDLSPCSKCAQ